jgi:hypothetical protein
MTVDDDSNTPTVDVDDQPVDNPLSSAEENEGIVRATKPGTDGRWKALKSFLDGLDPPIQKIPRSFPDRIIPHITILPVIKALACPDSQCPRAFSLQDTLNTHIRSAHPDHTPGDTDTYGAQECDAQTLGFKGDLSSLFRVLVVDMPTVTIDIADQMRTALFHQPHVSVPQVQLAGPQHERPFFRKFPYPSVFPESCPDRGVFVQACVPPISAVHREGADPHRQLLVNAIIVYYLQGRTILRNAPDLVRKHIANKGL